MKSDALKEQWQFAVPKPLMWVLYVLLSLILLRFYCYPSILNQTLSTSLTLSASLQDEKPDNSQIPCDFFKGKWIRDNSDPLYNGSSCSTIKPNQNCLKHGKPDTGYLHWQWQPNRCELSRFVPEFFLHLLRNKHLAFVGDSMARNQVESLLCLLSLFSSPELVYSYGPDNRFRRWRFSSHNATISNYWSPFLVMGIEKSPNGLDHNEIIVDKLDYQWFHEIQTMDFVVLNIGHWFLHPAVYFEGNRVLGCHSCKNPNHTEIGFYEVYRKSIKNTLKAIVNNCQPNPFVITVTFSPSHFDGDWDKAGACNLTAPFHEGEKVVGGMDGEMRRIVLEEVVAVNNGEKLSVQALDITELSLLRPDGHPGPYMYPFPFANGVKERVQNDCVHWCLPGPIDTWNVILLEMLKRKSQRDL